MMKRVLVAALIAASPLAAQQQADTLYVRNNFVKREARIPMRDGVHLFTTIYVPKDTTQRYPICCGARRIRPAPTATRTTSR